MRFRSAALCALLTSFQLPALAADAPADKAVETAPCADPASSLNRESTQALATLAQRCRDAKQWERALAWYLLGERRFPNQLHYPARQAMTLADAGRTAQALAKARALVEQHASSPDAWLALGYVQAAAGAPYDALSAVNQALRLAPQTPYVIVEHALALERAGLAHAAQHAAQQNASHFDAETLRRLKANYLAERVRLAALPSRSPDDSKRRLDQLIEEYDSLIAQWSAADANARQDSLRLRVDRIQALHARGYMHQTLQAYEDLDRSLVTVPDYVLHQVAAAYLATRQPEKASALYQKAQFNTSLTRREQVDIALGRFYAEGESGNFEQARTLIDSARDAQPVWVQPLGSPARQPNDLRMHTEAPWALGYLYANDTETAQKALEDAVSQAPQNSTLRIALASTYRARGWPRRAEEELKIAESQEPLSVALLAEQGQTALDLREWQSTRTLLDYLQKNAPDDSATKRLEKEWNRHNKAQLYVNAGIDQSRDNPVTGDDDLKLETVLYSAPLNQNWRLFAGVGQAQGDFPEGSVTQRHTRVGAQWQSRNLIAELEANTQHYRHKTRPGARLSAEYALNDQWTLLGGAAWHSLDTPLRALANDISSNRIELGVRWQRNEQGQWTLMASGERFSDGNTRTRIALRGTERIYTRPTYWLDAGLDVAASKNSKEDRPYFNPRRDLEVLPSVRLNHVLHQRYDTRLMHYVQLGAGVYHQQDYGSGAVGLIGYGIRYSVNENTEIGVSVTGISRPYDGQRERELRALLDISIRF